MLIDDSWMEDYYSLRNREDDAAKLLAERQWLLVNGTATLEPRRLVCNSTTFFGQYTLPYAFKIFLRLKSTDLTQTKIGWKHASASGNGYQITWSAEDTLVLQRLEAGTATTLVNATVTTENNTYFTLQILRSQDGNISIIINSSDAVNYNDTTYIGDATHNYYFFIQTSSATLSLTDGHLRDAVFSFHPYCRNLVSNAEYGVSYSTYYQLPYITLDKNTNAKIKLINDLLPNTDFYLKFNFTLVGNAKLAGLRIYFVSPDEKAGYYIEIIADGTGIKLRIVGADGTVKATSSVIVGLSSFNVHFNSATVASKLAVTSSDNQTTYVSYPATGSILDTLPSGLVMMMENISTTDDIIFNGCYYVAGNTWSAIANKNAVTSDSIVKIESNSPAF